MAKVTLVLKKKEAERLDLLCQLFKAPKNEFLRWAIDHFSGPRRCFFVGSKKLYTRAYGPIKEE